MKFRFPSLDVIAQSAQATFLRFPEALFAAFVTAGVGFWILERPGSDHNDLTFALLGCCAMGISLGFALATYAERRKIAPAMRAALMGGAALFLAALFFSHHLQSPESFIFRFCEFALAAHLLVAFLPYLGSSSEGFWEFNQRLFQRFAFAGFFTAVLYVGLVVAMMSIQFLLGFEFGAKAYGRLGIFCAFVFNPWFFMAGIPRPLPRKDLPEAFPLELAVFTKYLLIPLVTGYLVILYAYMAKIGFEWSMPKGTVGYLVSAFSLLGILALLLTHPIQQATENKWIRAYSHVFYFALYPLVGLLLLASFQRISEYGITERRYLLLILGFWLAAMATYFSFSRKKDIRAIPLSLFFLAVATTVGPWSAYSVSYYSQKARLEKLLTGAGLLVDGTVKPAPKVGDSSDAHRSKLDFEVSSAIQYMVESHQAAGIEDWFSETVKDQVQALKEKRFAINESGDEVARAMVEELNLNFTTYDKADRDTYHSFQADRGTARGKFMGVSGYDTVLPFSLTRYDSPSNTIVHWNGKPFDLTLDAVNNRLRIAWDTQVILVSLESLYAEEGVRILGDTYLDAKGQGLALRIFVDELSWRKDTQRKHRTDRISGFILLRR